MEFSNYGPSHCYNGVKMVVDPVGHLFRQADGTYLFGLERHPKLTRFIIPSVSDILKSCKQDGKKPPTIYIIFRRPTQGALRSLHFRFERTDVSKLSSELWRRVKAQDPFLKGVFEDLYKNVSEEWRKGRLIFEFFTPLTEAHGRMAAPNKEEKNKDSSVVVPSVITKSPNDKQSPVYICGLTESEERALTRELFSELGGHIPGFNYHLGAPSQD